MACLGAKPLRLCLLILHRVTDWMFPNGVFGSTVKKETTDVLGSFLDRGRRLDHIALPGHECSCCPFLYCSETPLAARRHQSY